MTSLYNLRRNPGSKSSISKINFPGPDEIYAHNLADRLLSLHELLLALAKTMALAVASF